MRGAAGLRGGQVGIMGPGTALTKENIQILFLGGSPEGSLGQGNFWRHLEVL